VRPSLQAARLASASPPPAAPMPCQHPPSAASSRPLLAQSAPYVAPPPQPPTQKRAAPFPFARDANSAEAAPVEANFRVALRLGVIDSLSRSPTDASCWHSRPSAEERAQIARLLLAHQARVAVANAPSYQSTLANALDWLARFSATTPSRELFVHNLHQADSEYNAFTFALLFEFIRETGSKQAGSCFGKQLKASSIAAINSTLNAHFSCFAGAPLYNPGANAALLRAAKQARSEDAPPGARAVAAPLRARHLRSALASGGLERVSPHNIVCAACLLLAHNPLARGRDLGIDAFSLKLDPSRDLTIFAFDWTAGARLVPPAFVVWLHPSKDESQRKV